jgi:hypothetical protein
MATTVAASFGKFRNNLEITDLQATTVSTRQTNVRSALEDDFTVLSSFLTGSYKRSTMIAPLKEADVDIFIVLSTKHYKPDGYTALLDSVKRALLKTYTKTPKISRNGHAVTITFTDFLVDVVPAFNRKGGGYLIPDSIEGRWISTDPTVHETVLTAANRAHNGALVPLIKMIKRWNRELDHAFRSFYLELLTRSIMSGVNISSDSSGMRYFFGKGREGVKKKQIDPAGLDSEQVNGLDTVRTVADAVSRFETAYSRALKAEQFEQAGKVQLAVAEWRKIFGDYFPAYG